MRNYFDKIRAEMSEMKKLNILRLLLIESVDEQQMDVIKDVEQSFLNHHKIIYLVFT